MKNSLVLVTTWIITGFAASAQLAGGKQSPINRYDLVSRHNVLLNKVDVFAPLTVGNGDFAYTADVTGMQSFGDYYHQNGIPLETMSTWAWHSFPNPKGLKMKDATKVSDFHGRKIAYASLEKSEAGEYFRKNPHPVALGQIGLRKKNGEELQLDEINHIQQKLNLWTGLVTSRYEIDGQPVVVETVSHPELSLVAFKIKSPLIKSGNLKPCFRFPYSYDLRVKNKPPFDWQSVKKHQTKILEQEHNKVLLERTIDDTRYHVNVQWEGNATWEIKGAHYYSVDGTGSDSLLLIVNYTQEAYQEKLPDFANTKNASARSWRDYWIKGGAIELAGSKDPRAFELERRVVLSQYLMKVHYAGSFPPQETGLAQISWYGKHNSEVYWLHSAQFYLWNRTELLEKGFQWYKQILPVAQADAKSKGFEGARWPKMAAPDGRESPGGINPFIIWNQPNPIYLSELIYRAHPDSQTLSKYRDIVFETAKFLASYAFYDSSANRYILGPPIKSVNESTEENNTKNPSFELAQWYHGLSIAQTWRERLGMNRDHHWDDILKKLSKIAISDGKYLEIETDPDMYKRTGGLPSAIIMALGYLPETPMIDKRIMELTFDTIAKRNGSDAFSSWSMGKWALAAARLGKQKMAVDIVCNELPAAKFHRSGYVQRPKEPLGCPAYLPVNSSFLAAVALMAAGWDGAPQINAPGFPQDGSWNVRVENLNKLP